VVINLSDGEFRLLMTLVDHSRRILTRDFLLDHARGPCPDPLTAFTLAGCPRSRSYDRSWRW